MDESEKNVRSRNQRISLELEKKKELETHRAALRREDKELEYQHKMGLTKHKEGKQKQFANRATKLLCEQGGHVDFPQGRYSLRGKSTGKRKSKSRKVCLLSSAYG